MTLTIPIKLPDIGEFADLAAEIPFIKAIAELAPGIDQLKQDVRAFDPSVETSQDVLTWLGAHVDSAQADTVFTALGLTALQSNLKAMKPRIAMLAPNAALLLKPVGDFAETQDAAATAAKLLPEGWVDGSDPGMIAWKPTASLPAPPLADAKLSLTLEGGLEIEAGALWPFSSDKVAPGLLRISAKGNVGAVAGARVPYQFVTFNGNADAEVACGIHFFFRLNDPRQLYAIALADAIGRMPDPFDAQAVWDAGTAGALEGLIFTFDGGAQLGIEVTLGKDLEVPELVSGKIAATISAELTRKADYHLSFRRIGDGNQTPRKLLARLSRESEAVSRWSAGVGVALDPKGLAARVKTILDSGLKDWGNALDTVKPLLLPGDWLRAHAKAQVGAAVGKLIADPALASALKDDLRLLVGEPITGEGIAETLGKRLTDAIDKVAGAATSAIDEFTNGTPGAAADKTEVIGALLKLALPSLDIPGAAQPLHDAITETLKAYAQGVAELANDLIARSGCEKIDGALKEIGIKVDGGVTDANALIKGVRETIERYDRFLRNVIVKAEEAIAAKVTAQLAIEESRISGSQYEVSGLFSAVDGDAGDLFRGLVLGRLTAIQRALAADAIRGFELDPDSSIRRFSRSTATLGYAVVLLGVDLEGGTVLSGKAEIWRSADGADLRISGEGGFKRWRRTWGEERALTFTSTQQLLIAHAQLAHTSAMLSLAATHTDQDLRLGEVRGFLDRLVDAGLLAARRRDAAATTFGNWAGIRGNNEKIAGTISVEMVFDKEGISALINGGRAVIADRNGGGARHLFRLAVTALRATGAWDEAAFRSDVRLCRGRPGLTSASAHFADPADFLFAVRDILPPDPVGPHARPLVELNSVRDRTAAAKAFVTIAQTSASIFDSPQATTKPWTEDDYRKAEKTLAGASAIWLRLGGIPLLPFREKMHRRTVALFLALACLARKVEPGSNQPAFDDMMRLTLQKSGEDRGIAL